MIILAWPSWAASPTNYSIWQTQGQLFLFKHDKLGMMAKRWVRKIVPNFPWSSLYWKVHFLSLDEVTSLMRLFPSLEAAVGTFGLAGLDRLLGLKIVTTLQTIVYFTDRTIFQVSKNFFHSQDLIIWLD